MSISGCSTSTCKSLSSISSHIASFDELTNALYFAIDDYKATMDCFLDDHDIGIVPILNMTPMVDLTCLIFPIQSKSNQNPIT